MKVEIKDGKIFLGLEDRADFINSIKTLRNNIVKQVDWVAKNGGCNELAENIKKEVEILGYLVDYYRDWNSKREGKI